MKRVLIMAACALLVLVLVLFLFTGYMTKWSRVYDQCLSRARAEPIDLLVVHVDVLHGPDDDSLPDVREVTAVPIVLAVWAAGD